MTPEEAVHRAFWTIKVPSMAALITPWLVFILLAHLGYIPSIGLPGFKWFLPMFIGGFVAGWLVWSIQIPRWRLWAYRLVDDIGELKRQAIDKQIIWPDGSFFEKTEISSLRLREEIRRLEQDKV